VRQKAYDIGMKSDVYNYWTQEDLKLLKKLYPNTLTTELAERLKRSAGSIKTRARQLGVRKSESYFKAIKSRPRKRRKKS
jgi:transcriptional regulator of aromatic amino acid metabolism